MPDSNGPDELRRAHDRANEQAMSGILTSLTAQTAKIEAMQQQGQRVEIAMTRIEEHAKSLEVVTEARLRALELWQQSEVQPLAATEVRLKAVEEWQNAATKYMVGMALGTFASVVATIVNAVASHVK